MSGTGAPPHAGLAGWLLLAAILTSVVHGLDWGVTPAVPGALFWSAGLLLALRVTGLQRGQTLLMLLAGSAGLLYAAAIDAEAQLGRALSTNQGLLAMLAGVTFLRLISVPAAAADEVNPRGPAALWRTLLGVHLFGSVINLSAVMIIGDRQTRRAPMTRLQATVLSRGFAQAALWSPFFAAMGIALSHAPGSQLWVLSSVGLPLAVFGLALTARTLMRDVAVDDYVGYPMHFAALWIPGLLAVLVMLAHQAWPGVSILTLVAGLSLTLSVFVLAVREPGAALRRLHAHIIKGLPGMSGELALFLAAGVLAAGIGSVVAPIGLVLDLVDFGASEASVLLLLMVGLAVAGVHPVISIATAHGLLAPLAPDPNLMGITYLMTWAAGVAWSPLSGMHLGMQGRFGIDARGFLRWNGRFTLAMLAADVVMLHVYTALVA